MPKKPSTQRTPRLTLAALAKKQEQLERRLAAFETRHNTMCDTLSHAIDEFTGEMKRLIVHRSIVHRSDETVERVLNSLMPYLSAAYDAAEAKRRQA